MIENDEKAIQWDQFLPWWFRERKKKCHVSTLMSLTGERRPWKTFSFPAFYRRRRRRRSFILITDDF
ncbi:hypothetical protein NC651_038691 [Populus alba x Populus x berolinensis]|nr:hypothetical protein NC651_038691 [Populus alba x Populus x berolinensis]